MKLAILDADILYDALRPRYASYGAMFETLLDSRDVGWDISTYQVINGQYPNDPAHYDAFLITGSKFDSFGDNDWIVALRNYAQMLYHSGKPVVGVCFGHQLLAHTLGGRAGRSDAGWGLGVMQFHLDQHPPFVDERDTVNLIVSHQDQVLTLPDNAQRLMSNDFCPNAAFYIPGRVLAIQGHPEFSVDYGRDLLALRSDQLAPDVVARVRSSFATPHDGALVGQWIRRFIEQSVNQGAENNNA